MDLMSCSNCGHPYRVGEVNFCTVCGQPLQTRENLVNEIKQIEREPKPYEALRFTSGLIVFFGWVVIIGGWMFAFTVGAIAAESLADTFSRVRNLTYLISSLLGFVFTMQGVFMIASGQVYMALLDIRNDTRASMKMIRRFGLAMFEKKE